MRKDDDFNEIVQAARQHHQQQLEYTQSVFRRYDSTIFQTPEKKTSHQRQDEESTSWGSNSQSSFDKKQKLHLGAHYQQFLEQRATIKEKLDRIRRDVGLQ